MTSITEKIKPKLLEAITKIAKNENTTESEVINDLLEKGIEEREILEEKLKYPEGIPLKLVAEELGLTPEILRKRLDDANERIEKGKGIVVDVDKLEERYL